MHDLHFLPLAGVVLLVAIALVLRPLVQLRRHGTLGVVLFRSGRPAQNVRDALVFVLFGLLLGQAMIAAVRPQALDLLISEKTALHVTLQLAGAGIMLLGTALLAVAQLDMGASWRIGIDAGARPGLITGGLYRYSRNPIYLGLLTAIAGYACMLPTDYSLAALVGAYIGVRSQIASEEAYLRTTYGDAFREYARRVGRFVPGLGLLKT